MVRATPFTSGGNVSVTTATESGRREDPQVRMRAEDEASA
jgi:hypothetical protein